MCILQLKNWGKSHSWNALSILPIYSFLYCSDTRANLRLTTCSVRGLRLVSPASNDDVNMNGLVWLSYLILSLSLEWNALRVVGSCVWS